MADKAFGYVYKALRQRWFNQFMDLGGAGREQDELAARLRALDAIPVELGLLLNEYRNDLRMKPHAS